MDHFREIKNSLTWHNEGKFEVELINGIITKLNFCEPGKGSDDSGKCLTSINYKFLQSVYSCLGDLFVFIEEENKRLGYKYAHESEIPKHEPDETAENTYPLLGDNNIRPLNDYTHQPESMDSSGVKDELIRDAG